jgi:hypothetical protein
MRGEVDGTLTDFAIFGGVGSDVETVFGGLEWEGAVVEMSDCRVHVNIWESTEREMWRARKQVRQ